MKIKKVLTTLVAIYGLLLLSFLIVNTQFLFIEDAGILISIIVMDLIFIVVFFILSLVMASNYQKKINAQNKTINELKGKLYDAIKDEKEKDKMLKDFENSLQ